MCNEIHCSQKLLSFNEALMNCKNLVMTDDLQKTPAMASIVIIVNSTWIIHALEIVTEINFRILL